MNRQRDEEGENASHGRSRVTKEAEAGSHGRQEKAKGEGMWQRQVSFL